MISVGLPTYLRTIAGVTGIVGDRIYYGKIPQHVYNEATKQPCLVHQYPGSIRQALFCGTDSLVDQALQIDCYARVALERDQLARAVRIALIDYSGLMGDVIVKKVLWGDADFPRTDPEPGLYVTSQFYRVWFVDA
jgi:hypothetical protein